MDKQIKTIIKVQYIESEDNLAYNCMKFFSTKEEFKEWYQNTNTPIIITKSTMQYYVDPCKIIKEINIDLLNDEEEPINDDLYIYAHNAEGLVYGDNSTHIKPVKTFGMENYYSNVDHPKHYNKPGRKECIEEMIEKYGVLDVIIFCKLNAFKYQYRFDEKNGVEDLEKGIWYLNKAVELLNSILTTCG